MRFFEANERFRGRGKFGPGSAEPVLRDLKREESSGFVSSDCDFIGDVVKLSCPFAVLKRRPSITVQSFHGSLNPVLKIHVFACGRGNLWPIRSFAAFTKRRHDP